jgi:hypothetical protein
MAIGKKTRDMFGVRAPIAKRNIFANADLRIERCASCPISSY